MCPTMIITYSDSDLGGMEKGFKTAMLAFSFFHPTSLGYLPL